MTAPQQVQKCVARILKTERRKGETTKQGCVALVMNNLSRGGNGYAIPPALLHAASKHIVASEIDRQLKQGLPANIFGHALRNAPPELAQVLPNLPAWIATSEGAEARWVPSLQASAADWMANAQMKDRKARQTKKKANASADISRYLSEYGMSSLSDSVSFDEEAA